MSLAAIKKTASSPYSVLVVSSNPDFTGSLQDRFFDGDPSAFGTVGNGFVGLKDQVPSMAFANDVVLFEALADNPSETEALRALLTQRKDGTVFIGLSDDNMPMSKVHELRALGVDDVLPVSISGADLHAAIDKALPRSAAPVAKRPGGAPGGGRIIAVAQARGGIGATTVAVNLACALAGRPHWFRKGDTSRVALLDLDLQFGNANVLMDLEDNGAFRRMIEDGERPDAEYALGMVQRHESGVEVISAPVSVLPLNAVETDAIRALLTALQSQYDYVVVDLPRALVDWIEPVIRRADAVQVVTDLSVPSLRHAKRLIDFFQEVKTALPVRVVLNHEAKPMVKSGPCRDAEDLLDQTFEHWLPDAPKHARKAVDLGRPVVAEFAGSPLGKAFMKLAEATRTDLAAEEKIHKGA
ncbi:AAA family ATPase [Actibacterium sp. XHP0104]|uniref:AAA family ATPase n=1 Tax=Actibacterium sp. XHP0104 TaxID=2984335 RepID=UPI0021E9A7B5|nr:AAA family ATPase [Actibacterium sp. XHP0104]MCV2882972.1 AAA family ATPase [Actibacterium sp. XHP0104]